MDLEAKNLEMTADRAGFLLIDPSTYTQPDLLWDVCTALHRDDPFHVIDHPDFPTVTAITRHRDVKEISLHSREFSQGKYPFLHTLEEIRLEDASDFEMPRNIVRMDGDEHHFHRQIVAGWFTPRNIARMQDRISDLAKTYVADMLARGSSCDFALVVAKPFPLQVILSLLGLPESDYDFLLKLSQQQTAHTDDELSSGDLVEIAKRFHEYFMGEVAPSRRATPTDDLSSAVANARLPTGEPIGDSELLGWYQVLVTAGHDTTSSAMAGGIAALAANPDEWKRLRDDPNLIPRAADEMIRWTTPVKHFKRTVVEPYQVAERRFEPGEEVFLSYVAANLDPLVFDDPHRFDVGRSPNDHLAFGFGTHYCLAAHLAKMEVRALLTELVARVEELEPDGEPEYIRSYFIGGPKRVPIRWSPA